VSTVLPREEWTVRARMHAERLEPLLGPHLARRLRGEKHPVHDFLFTYYSQRPAALRRWHPGYGVALAGAAEYAGLKGYEAGGFETGSDGPPQPPGAVGVGADFVARQAPLLGSIATLLRATEGRAAHLGCFGLHEWAMVYRLEDDETRHADWPLRLGPTGTDAVVESHRIACSHFDAFRFFTEPARSRNTLQPGRDDRASYEQPDHVLHGRRRRHRAPVQRLEPRQGVRVGDGQRVAVLVHRSGIVQSSRLIHRSSLGAAPGPGQSPD
jgi:hypothetical protein